MNRSDNLVVEITVRREGSCVPILHLVEPAFASLEWEACEGGAVVDRGGPGGVRRHLYGFKWEPSTQLTWIPRRPPRTPLEHGIRSRTTRGDEEPFDFADPPSQLPGRWSALATVGRWCCGHVHAIAGSGMDDDEVASFMAPILADGGTVERMPEERARSLPIGCPAGCRGLRRSKEAETERLRRLEAAVLGRIDAMRAYDLADEHRQQRPGDYERARQAYDEAIKRELAALDEAREAQP